MPPWLIALLAGLLFSALQYGRLVAREGPGVVALALLRAAAITLLVALLLDARAGPDRAPAPLVALDASQSWTRGGGTRWREAVARARSLAPDSLLLFGDSLRVAPGEAQPRDHASSLDAVAERAAADGRPVVLVTDGEVEPPTVGLASLPRGSRIELLAAPARPDVAVSELEAPRAVADGDTLRVGVSLVAGSAAVPAGTLILSLGAREIATQALPALAPRATQRVELAVRVASPDGPQLLRAVASVAGDAEPRNDTLLAAVDVSPSAGAVWVSGAPDLDSRAALAVLRGALRVPTRAFLRVAPGTWRVEGTLEPVSEAAVREAVERAPLLVVHGDTAVFGPPRALAGDAPLALLPGPGPEEGRRDATAALDEWYPSAAPPSPAATALAGAAWDSLPPVALGPGPVPRAPTGAGAWTAVEGRRGRRGPAAPFVVGTESPRRVVVSYAKGTWRWEARGGPGATAYQALWGSLFDWLADARRDRRAVVPERAYVRAGEPVRWRLSGEDSVARITLARRGDSARVQTLTLPRLRGTMFAQSPTLPAGVYDVEAEGGRSILVVNVARELLPRAPQVQGGPVGEGVVASATPSLRRFGLAYAAVVLLLSIEWVLRRRRGLR